MFSLTLSLAEKEALVDVLECAISEIRSEIVHTDPCDFKEMLKTRKQTLINLLETLREPSTQPA